MEKFFACAAWSVVLPTVPQFCTARDKAGRKARAKRTRIFPTCSDYRVDGCLCAQVPFCTLKRNRPPPTKPI